jgi:Xaa-Pro dipeptidase
LANYLNVYIPNLDELSKKALHNPYVITPGNVFFMHMILMDSDSNLAMNLGETYLVTENGNERLGKQKLDLVVL